MKIGIAGYGNLGRGTESAVISSPDMDLVGIFTRRNPESVHTASGAPVFSLDAAASMTGDIDVMIICGGSASDLHEMNPKLARLFNVIDSFDTHAKIPAHFNAVDAAASESGHTAIISVGWDPGMFSVKQLYSTCILPCGRIILLGARVSQGHSDAVRRIPGVIDARQYTVPLESALEAARSGNDRQFTAGEMHRRECYVVAADGADTAAIENAIKTMPNYFADYETTVHFISADEMKREHSGLPHGGMMLRTGKSGDGSRHTIEYRLTLESNPAFTGSVLTAFARAAYRLSRKEISDAKRFSI